MGESRGPVGVRLAGRAACWRRLRGLLGANPAARAHRLRGPLARWGRCGNENSRQNVSSSTYVSSRGSSSADWRYHRVFDQRMPVRCRHGPQVPAEPPLPRGRGVVGGKRIGRAGQKNPITGQQHGADRKVNSRFVVRRRVVHRGVLHRREVIAGHRRLGVSHGKVGHVAAVERVLHERNAAVARR